MMGRIVPIAVMRHSHRVGCMAVLVGTTHG
jgi:hypothetical protein